MKNKEQSSLKEIPEPEISYFGLQAFWGASKPHMGGFEATEELIELCHINKDKYVLDVGCGVGITPCYIAKKYGCRVVGVDISEKMINWANKMVRRKGVEDRVELRVADAQNLPFEDNLFGAVICESIIAFVEDKQKAVSEYVRVTKPGGYIGLNEATWLRASPPTELVGYISRITGAKLDTSDDWKELLECDGLMDIVVRTHKINALSQFVSEIRQFGLKDYLRGWYRFFYLLIKNSAFRKYLKEAWPPRSILKDYFQYLGYGIYVGRK